MSNEELLIGLVKQTGMADMYANEFLTAARKNGKAGNPIMKGEALEPLNLIGDRLQRAVRYHAELKRRSLGLEPVAIEDGGGK